MDIQLLSDPSIVITTGRVFMPGTPSEIVQLPTIMDNVVLGPGVVLPAAQAVLAPACRMIRRIVPWAPIVFSPRAYVPYEAKEAYSLGRQVYQIDGRNWVEVRGLSSWSDGTIHLTAGAGAQDVMSVAAHEAWHSLECSLVGLP